jgi:hypothetical protein
MTRKPLAAGKAEGMVPLAVAEVVKCQGNRALLANGAQGRFACPACRR